MLREKNFSKKEKVPRSHVKKRGGGGNKGEEAQGLGPIDMVSGTRNNRPTELHRVNLLLCC